MSPSFWGCHISRVQFFSLRLSSKPKQEASSSTNQKSTCYSYLSWYCTICKYFRLFPGKHSRHLPWQHHQWSELLLVQSHWPLQHQPWLLIILATHDHSYHGCSSSWLLIIIIAVIGVVSHQIQIWHLWSSLFVIRYRFGIFEQNFWW